MSKSLAILLMFLLYGSAAAAETSTEILTRAIKVVDQQGQPVAGAFADAWLINEQYFWPTKILPRKTAKSDKDGIAQLEYPTNASLGIVDLPVESIKITVSHAEFLSQDVVVPVAGALEKPFEIKLTPGVSLTLSAIDEEGRPVTEPFAVMSTKMPSTPRWNRPSPHTVQSRMMSNGNHQLMLVQPGKDGHDLFSSVMTYHFDKQKEPEVLIEDIELLRGIAVRGKLAADVPRPIKHGHVIAVHIPLPVGDSWDEKLPSLLYYNSADLHEDGTFIFPSMPRTGTIQLITVCDGWVGLLDKDKPLVVGETFDVDEADLNVEVKMERTFVAKIRVVDTAGDPVEGINVACSPNQLFKKGGSSWLGERFDSMPMLKSQLLAEPVSLPQDMENAFQARSDKQGQLVIRNLPRNRWSATFSVWADLKAPVKIEAMEDGVRAKLPDKDQNEVEFDVKVKVIK